MNLQDFLKLHPDHTISFNEGKDLHKDICKQMPIYLTNDQSCRLKEYLESCLLYKSIEQNLINELEFICKNIHIDDNTNVVQKNV